MIKMTALVIGSTLLAASPIPKYIANLAPENPVFLTEKDKLIESRYQQLITNLTNNEREVSQQQKENQ